MGQQMGLRKRFIVFQPNSIVSASDMSFFFKIFVPVVVLLLAQEFQLRQISGTFWLEMGQHIRLRKRFIAFQPNSIVSASDMAFFSKFLFRWSFFFLRQYSVSGKLVQIFVWKIGQWEGLPRRIIVFQRNSNVLVFEMVFFKNFRFSAHFYRVPKFCFA